MTYNVYITHFGLFFICTKQMNHRHTANKTVLCIESSLLVYLKSTRVENLDRCGDKLNNYQKLVETSVKNTLNYKYVYKNR